LMYWEYLPNRICSIWVARRVVSFWPKVCNLSFQNPLSFNSNENSVLLIWNRTFSANVFISNIL
jgi:hypothetical protein